MGHVAYADGVLLIDIREEGSLVVDAEVEDAMLVGRDERRAVDRGISGSVDRLEIEAVEGGEHGEFELEGVGVGQGEWVPAIPRVFGQGDAVGLS